MIVQVKWKGAPENYVCGEISSFISETIQNMAIVTIENRQELVRDLSNGAISNDLEHL